MVLDARGSPGHADWIVATTRRLALLICTLVATGCTAAPPAPALPVATSGPTALLTPAPGVSGRATIGEQLIIPKGCGGCHTVAGVPGATGVAGPNLTNVVLRPTLAGNSIPMSADTMTRWLLDPPAVKPGTTMPSVGLSTDEARDLTAFLFSQPDNPEP